jgi:trimeric autotransporter adhesin
MRKLIVCCALIGTGLFIESLWAAPLGTAFTYQGELIKSGSPVTDTCDFTFGLWDADAAGNQVGNSPQGPLAIAVENGDFTTIIDFGTGTMTGEARWLEIEVECPGDGAPTLLAPRVELKPVPHALALPGLYTQENATSPNVIGGFSGNFVTPGVFGATIGGGGQSVFELINKVSGNFGTVGGGRNNTASDTDSTVSGGEGNTASEDASTVGGGVLNTASGWFSTVGGGSDNTASGSESTVGGGDENAASAHGSTVGGGRRNAASESGSTVGGGGNNAASGGSSTVGGGASNTASGSRSTVGGGFQNTGSGYSSTVGGGATNTASEVYATIGGGLHNRALAAYATIAGGGPGDPIFDPSGTNNRVFDNFGTIGGGGANRAGTDDVDPTNSSFTTVAGGLQNIASGSASTIGGGSINTASESHSTVGGGYQNTASGDYSTIPGGRENQAGGDYSFAAGRRAKVRDAAQAGNGTGDQGTFIWADSTDADFNSDGENRFLVRASGGTVIYSDSGLTAGVSLAPGGGSWSSVSDRNLKENIEPVDGRDALERLSRVPIATWNYTSQDPSIRHIGPMGQDFHEAFGLGEEPPRISTIDADGVALAAIQGLHELVKDKDCEIAELREQQEREIAALRAEKNDLAVRNAELEERLNCIESLLADRFSEQNEGAR